MVAFDLPLEQLQAYLPDRQEPADFDAFWADTLAEARRHEPAVVLKPIDIGLRTVETWDVTFSGFGGHRIKGWLIMPAVRTEPLSCVIEYVGYGGGRGLLVERLLWAAAGHAHFVMDNRGQGTDGPVGETPDPDAEGVDPHYPGFMTRGALDPRHHYYRRLFTDAARAVDAVQTLPRIDSARIAAYGRSQGGGIAIAAAGLHPGISVLMTDVPFLCHYRRATQITDTEPYVEIVRYLKVHREKVDQVFRTLGYFDAMNFAPSAHARALFSVGLMDDVCPPSTVFAAYNHYAGPKEIRVWPFNVHEGGGPYQLMEQVRFLARAFGT